MSDMQIERPIVTCGRALAAYRKCALFKSVQSKRKFTHELQGTKTFTSTAALWLQLHAISHPLHIFPQNYVQDTNDERRRQTYAIQTQFFNASHYTLHLTECFFSSSINKQTRLRCMFPTFSLGRFYWKSYVLRCSHSLSTKHKKAAALGHLFYIWQPWLLLPVYNYFPPA